MAKILTAQLDLPPDVIDFGAGQPSLHLLPLVWLREAAASRLGDNDAAYLAYGAMPGDGYFRQVLADYLGGHYQMPVDFDNLFVTGRSEEHTSELQSR